MSIQLMRRAAFTICILAVGLFAAENPFAGIWKLKRRQVETGWQRNRAKRWGSRRIRRYDLQSIR